MSAAAATAATPSIDSDDKPQAKNQNHQSNSPTSVLLQWLSSFGVTSESTGLLMWEGNGSEEERGLRAHRTIKRSNHNNPSEREDKQSSTGSNSSTNDSPAWAAPVICIPEPLLITPSKVRNSSIIQSMWGKSQANRATDSELLCSFLIHQHRLGSKSKWSPYINTLPKHYTSIEWWNDTELISCQIDELVLGARKRREIVRREWAKCKNLALGNDQTDEEKGEAAEMDTQLPYHWSDSIVNHTCDASGGCTSTRMCSPPSLAEYQWAWATVSTRSCFLPQISSSTDTQINRSSSSNLSTISTDSDLNRSCLIPYLDMLNHHSEVMVDCRLTSQQYELYVVEPSPCEVKVGSELFINYGPHSNPILVERYGFALLNNRHERMELSLQHVDRVLSSPHALLSDAQYSLLSTSWILPSHLQFETLSLRSCSCAKNYPITESLSKWPRYRTPFPGIGDAIEGFQLKLLRACGLYELSDAKEKSDPTTSSCSTPYSFRLFPCALGADLSLYLRIRALSREDVQLALHLSSTRSPKPASADKSATRGKPPIAIDFTSSSTLNDVDASYLTGLLLDDRTPYLSQTHRAVTQRLVFELVLAELFNPNGFGLTSIQNDFDSYTNTSMPYVHQIAFLLRISQKRMLHSILVHFLLE